MQKRKAMNQDSIYRKIVHILDHYGIDISSITPEASFSKDLGLDSLDFTELTMEAEVAFEVEIPFDESEQVDTVGDLINLIEQLQKQTSLAANIV